MSRMSDLALGHAREQVVKLSVALKEACDVAAFYCGEPGDDADTAAVYKEHALRIAELRKLIEGM